MKNPPISVALLALALVSLAGVLVAADSPYPQPSPYPISWELNFEHGTPRRIAVDVPGQTVPQAYWYLTYTVTNNTDQEQIFLPVFEMVTREGQVIRSDKNIPQRVFEAIKAREKKPFLESFPGITGELRLGEDQARDGVAIWPEPEPRMGSFAIFISGLSGETALAKDASGQPMKDGEGKPVILRKTLQLNYIIRGDEVYPGEDEVHQNSERWVMR